MTFDSIDFLSFEVMRHMIGVEVQHENKFRPFLQQPPKNLRKSKSIKKQFG